MPISVGYTASHFLLQRLMDVGCECECAAQFLHIRRLARMKPSLHLHRA